MSKTADWKARPDDPVYQDMRDKILRSASEIIAETGVAGMRLDIVARRAGLARSSLYRYFDGKDQVVFELLVFEFNKLTEKMLVATSHIDDSAEKFLEIMFLSVESFRTDPSLSRLLGAANEKSVPMISFALESLPDLMQPYLAEYGFFDSCSAEVRQRRYRHLALWMLQAIFSFGVFGNGGCSRAQERELIRDMVEPVIRS